jgi:hypothetical protein
MTKPTQEYTTRQSLFEDYFTAMTEVDSSRRNIFNCAIIHPWVLDAKGLARRYAPLINFAEDFSIEGQLSRDDYINFLESDKSPRNRKLAGILRDTDLGKLFFDDPVDLSKNVVHRCKTPGLGNFKRGLALAQQNIVGAIKESKRTKGIPNLAFYSLLMGKQGSNFTDYLRANPELVDATLYHDIAEDHEDLREATGGRLVREWEQGRAYTLVETGEGDFFCPGTLDPSYVFSTDYLLKASREEVSEIGAIITAYGEVYDMIGDIQFDPNKTFRELARRIRGNDSKLAGETPEVKLGE